MPRASGVEVQVQVQVQVQVNVSVPCQTSPNEPAPSLRAMASAARLTSKSLNFTGGLNVRGAGLPSLQHRPSAFSAAVGIE